MDRSEVRLHRIVVAVSGGADSVYLVYRGLEKACPLLMAHFNHRARAKESNEDQKFVEQISRSLGLPIEVGAPQYRRSLNRTESGTESKARPKSKIPGFESKARKERYDFLYKVNRKHGAKGVLVAHTADDQVETVLMRMLEGAGIAGLKGIPRKTKPGSRPRKRPSPTCWSRARPTCSPR